ncbi:MAG: winged helix-turn-helix transcriptional regulator [Candidatus ainarchaeum sp.]|nr:winged helix-turn-helix transcriptional regulator [Candidatus ainarchaeum sp.]
MKKIILIAFFLTIISFSFAQEYYADITIDVLENGETIINGTSNHPILNSKTTQEYTSKQGEKWILEINTQNIFSEYIYEINFPQEVEIEQIETEGNYRITTKEGKIAIISVGKNLLLKIKIEYIFNKQKTINYTNIIIIILIILIITGTYFLIKINKNKKNKTTYDLDYLTERQLKIINLINENAGKITQAELQKKLNYPKASLSRNLNTLIKKEIIEKERKGMTMLIKIKKNNILKN